MERGRTGFYGRLRAPSIRCAHGEVYLEFQPTSLQSLGAELASEDVCKVGLLWCYGLALASMVRKAIVACRLRNVLSETSVPA